MSISFTDNQHYSDIANAIRNKNGESMRYKPSEMANAINSINIGIDNMIPEFTYTGEYDFITEDSNELNTLSSSSDIADFLINWKIRFKTSGTLCFSNLKGQKVDVFCVGGGGSGGWGGIGKSYGGGGGGGYTKSSKSITLQENVNYPIVVGLGGSGDTVYNAGSYSDVSNNGGESSAFGVKASGGCGGVVVLTSFNGYSSLASWSGNGNGGSAGGGPEGLEVGTKAPGINGGDAQSFSYRTSEGIVTVTSRGQIHTPGINGETGSTREFGEETGKIYAYGGCGYGVTSENDGGSGVPNNANYLDDAKILNGKNGTGSGGGGSFGDNDGVYYGAGSGGSGIVIIRNSRQ